MMVGLLEPLDGLRCLERKTVYLVNPSQQVTTYTITCSFPFQVEWREKKSKSEKICGSRL